MTKRIISLAIAVIMLCTALCACKPKNPPELTPREIYSAAQKKLSELNDITANAKIDMKVMQGTVGMSISCSVSANSFVKNARSDNPVSKTEMTLSMMGIDMSTVSYTVDGYTYTDTMGMKVKEKTTDSSYDGGIIGTLNDEMFDDITAEKQADGTTLLTFTINMEKLQDSDFVKNILSSVDGLVDEFEDVDITWEKMGVKMTVNADGYVGKVDVDTKFSMQMDEESISYEMKIESSYVNIGEPVEFELPNLDEYEEYSEDDPEFDF